MTKRLWAGLDVGVESTRICVINDAGEVLHEASCPTQLKKVSGELIWLKRRRHAKIGLEAGTGTSIARGLRSLGYSVEMYETRKLSKFLRVRRNKTDAGDARGIAEAGRIGATLVSKVHLKSLECQALQSRLTIRRHLIRERVAAVTLLGRQIELFGGRMGRCRSASELHTKAEAEIKKLFGTSASALRSDLHLLLDHCEQLIAFQHETDRVLKRLALTDELSRRLMQIPGVGPICALTFYATIGEPHRFLRSSDIGPYLGLTPKSYQSGLTLKSGRVSRMGNSALRGLLGHSSLLYMKFGNPRSELRRWASRIEQRRGRGKARVALARKLAVIMLTMWKTGENYKEIKRDHASAHAQ